MGEQAQVYCTSGRHWEQKESIRCTFCGGKKCLRCGDTAHTVLKSKAAFEKFHSTWITSSIVAMQRPSDELIVSLNLIEKFSSAGVSAVFNLTQPGEHPFCGHALKSSGFPYTPENLMNAGIKHFNYSWKDMDVPSLSLMMDIVQVAITEIRSGGKVAVHCHAGFGRTGLSIAAIMLALDVERGSDDIIEHIRKTRRGSIQTAPQENFIKDFERQFLMLCNTFGDNDFVLPPIVNGDIAVAVDPTTVSVPLTARPVQSNRVGSPGARLTSPKSTPVKPKGGDTDSNGDALSVSTGGGMIQNLNVSSLDPSAFPEGLMSPGRANKSRGLAQIITGGLKPTPPKSRPFASTVPKTIHDTVKSQHFTLLSSEMLEYRYVAKCIVVTNKTVKECVNVLSACSGDVSAADQTPVKLLPHILSLVGKVNEYELCVHCGAVSSDYQSSALYLHQFTEDTALRDALRILRQKVNTCEYESNWLSSYALPSSDGACVGELWLKYEDRCSCLCVLLLNWLDSRQDALLTSVFMAELAALAADYPISASSANAEGVATGQVTLTCYLDGIRRLLSRVKAATLGHIIAILGSLHVTNPAVVDSGVNFRELLALRFAVSMLPYDLRTAARFVFLRVMQDLLGSHAVADTNSSSSSTSVSSLLSAYGQESNVFESTVKSGKDKMLEQSKEKGYSFKSDRAVISPSILSSSSSDVASSVSSVTSSENADNTMVRSVIEEMIGRYDIVSSLIAPGADVSGMDMGVGMAGNAGGIRWKPGVPAAATLPVTVPVV